MLSKRGLVIIAMVFALAFSSVCAVWAAEEETVAEAKAFNTVNLDEGEYKPDSFSWSGGSGRLEYIRCDRIEVRDGGAYADLEFASPNYDHLKVAGRTYKRTEVSDDTSQFQVPVKLNANLEIEGRTTAMSQPHWIPYTIYVGKKGAEADGEAMIDTEALEAQNKAMKKELLDEAPVIIGFDGGKKAGLNAAQHLRIFQYEGGAALIQVERSAVDSDAVERGAEGGKTIYDQRVVNYLVVPEDAEAPAGAEKDFVVIRQNPQKVFVDGEQAMAVLTDSPLKREVSDGTALARGEFRELAAESGTKLCVMSEDKVTADIAGKLVILQIPMFIDCSESESGEMAKQEWALAYGEIFGAREQAKQAVAEAEEQADREKKQQQTAAVILLLGIVAAMGIIPAAAKRG